MTLLPPSPPALRCVEQARFPYDVEKVNVWLLLWLIRGAVA